MWHNSGPIKALETEGAGLELKFHWLNNRSQGRLAWSHPHQRGIGSNSISPERLAWLTRTQEQLETSQLQPRAAGLNSPATCESGLRRIPPRADGWTLLKQTRAGGFTHPHPGTKKSSSKGGWLDSTANQEVKVSFDSKKLKTKVHLQWIEKLRNSDNHSPNLTW